MTLQEIIDQLGVEELEVLRLTAERLLEGQTSYDLLDLVNDDRDFEKEIRDEELDKLNYTSMLYLKRRLRAKHDTDPAPPPYRCACRLCKKDT